MLTEPSERRWKPVRLSDVPLDRRLKAVSDELRYVKDSDEAQALLAAAISPSPTVYYIALT